MQEQFKDIPGYEGYYVIGNKGTVKSVARTITRRDGYTQRLGEKNIYPVHMRDRKNNYDYYVVPLSKNSKMELVVVAKAVLQVFRDDYDQASMYITYKDGDPKNCALNNLNYQYMVSRAGGAVVIHRGSKKKKFINLRQATKSLKMDHKDVLDKYTGDGITPSKGITLSFESPFVYNRKTITEIQL